MKWTLLATTGSSQPLIMDHIPGESVNEMEWINWVGAGLKVVWRFRSQIEGRTLKDPGGFMN